MTWRLYFSDVVGTGTVADPFRPAVEDVVSGVKMRHTDGRVYGASGRMLVRADVSLAQHAAIVAAAGITYIPLEDAAGDPVDLATGTVGDVSAANRTLISTRLEAQHVPTQDFTLSTSLLEVLARIRLRFLLRRILRADDWTEGLDTLVSAIAGPKRTAVAATLQARGFDTSGIVGTDTEREAIRKLMAQAADVLKVSV